MNVKNFSGTAIRQSCANVPTPYGDFVLCVYRIAKDDGALLGECADEGPAYGSEIRVIYKGTVEGAEELPVRVHSECFTGDVMGSLRCDCGDQLHKALQIINLEDRGMLIYLPQEGRGIGLAEKLKAYNLQDQGLDTVEANLQLGHDADLRDYNAAALILRDFQIKSIRLLTNNPSKIENLREYGITISGRIPVICAVNPFSERYMATKSAKMRHILTVEQPKAIAFPASGHTVHLPYVTLSYAQSLDGSLAGGNGHRLILSGEQSMRMTHRIRAEHQAILVGIGTVLADDPQLTVRLAEGSNPQPVVLDSLLRIPLDSYLASRHPRKTWVFASRNAPVDRRETLEALGLRVFTVSSDQQGRLDLTRVCEILAENGIRSLMVEGGLEVISGFLGSDLVDRLVITISPRFVGGRRIDTLKAKLPELRDVSQFQLGGDIVVEGFVKKS
ncbi:MAG: GTP cyclohydrolase II [Spirochaetes bacterium GWB1_59_5]|nr:MAG: GTP cyclohydrolase II [Spirochaetes bacterium GWB1_59_5]